MNDDEEFKEIIEEFERIDRYLLRFLVFVVIVSFGTIIWLT